MKCPECQRSFPGELINPSFMHGRYIVHCPLCALIARNNIHGMRGEPFGGQMAREMFERARAHIEETGQELTEFEQEIPRATAAGKG